MEHYQRVYEPIASMGAVGENEADEGGGSGGGGAGSGGGGVGAAAVVDHETEYSYIKCIDRGTQTIMNKIEGYMPGRIAQFITNCCHCHWTKHKKLYLSRHGQSQYNATGRIGGDSDLTDMGERYALALRDFASSDVCVDAQTGVAVPARLWTSTLKRTRNTARHITQ